MFEEIDRPAAKAFVARWHAKYPDETYINDMGENEYSAIYMYKKLVEMANSTELDKIPDTVLLCQHHPVYTIGRSRLQPRFQPDEVSLEMIRRISAAIEDLDSLGAVGL